MEINRKQRLLGLTVIVAIVIVIVPFLIGKHSSSSPTQVTLNAKIPPRPGQPAAASQPSQLQAQKGMTYAQAMQAVQGQRETANDANVQNDSQVTVTSEQPVATQQPTAQQLQSNQAQINNAPSIQVQPSQPQVNNAPAIQVQPSQPQANNAPAIQAEPNQPQANNAPATQAEPNQPQANNAPATQAQPNQAGFTAQPIVTAMPAEKATPAARIPAAENVPKTTHITPTPGQQGSASQLNSIQMNLASVQPAPSKPANVTQTDNGVKQAQSSGQATPGQLQVTAGVIQKNQPLPSLAEVNNQIKVQAATAPEKTTAMKTMQPNIADEQAALPSASTMGAAVAKPVTPKPATSAKAKPKVKHAWAIQMGLFGHAQNADNLVTKLKAAGYPAYSEELFTPRGRMTRVMVGPAATYSDIKAMRDKIHQQNHIEGVIKPSNSLQAGA